VLIFDSWCVLKLEELSDEILHRVAIPAFRKISGTTLSSLPKRGPYNHGARKFHEKWIILTA
jgi:hypothetical protein